MPLFYARHYEYGFLSFFSPTRVVLETVEKLQVEGHELVKFHVPNPSVAADVFFRAFMPDNGAYALSRFRGEAVDPYTKELIMAFKVLPNSTVYGDRETSCRSRYGFEALPLVCSITSARNWQ